MEGSLRAATERPGAARRALRWAVLALSLLAGLALPECALRWLLFSDSETAVRMAERWKLRRPELFADSLYDDDFWKLRRLFQADEQKRLAGPRVFDPLLGWRTHAITPEYDHIRRLQRAGAVEDRRPMLLVFGASYCDGPFDEVFESSDLAREYDLVNYAIGGSGPDQALLLMRACLPHFEGEDVAVAIGFEVNNDFDRVALSFRDHPKPRARLSADGELVFDRRPQPSVAVALEEDPPRIPSYAWRAFSTGRLSAEERAALAAQRMAEKQRVAAAIVLAIDRELTERRTPYFYVLFNNASDCAEGQPREWERFLVDLFERERIAYQVTRPVVRRALERNGEKLDAYFVQRGNARVNHPSERGLEVVLSCFRDGLAKALPR